ncbi:MAG: 3-deoxy-7-phosphoheptulonate synthase, partial [Candidatus Rokuibacteriota bacterium]
MKTRDLRIDRIQPLLPPAILIEEQPLSEKGSLMVTRAREEVSDILAGRSDRVLVVVGPCSVHDPAAAQEYAVRLRKLAEELAPDLCVV